MEEESTLTVVSPLTNTPIPMKKSLGVSADDTPRIKSGPLALLNQEEGAKEQTAICQASDEKTLGDFIYDVVSVCLVLRLETLFVTQPIGWTFVSNYVLV